MRRRQAGALLLLFIAAAAAADQAVFTSGPADQKLNLVFLGDGYAAAEMPAYAADVQRFSDYLFTQPPFSTHKNIFNVYRVDLVSSQSGADDQCAGTSVDTALDAGFYPTGSDCRMLFTYSGAKVYAAAARAPGYMPGAGLVVVLVNSSTYGGAATAGGYAVIFHGSNGPEVLAHEIGHSLGLLADEYGQSGIYSGGEPAQPNATTQTNRSLVKWARWIDPATALPTVGTAADLPGLYEGGDLFQFGVFRPTYNSKMRTLGQPYERVDEALLVGRLDALQSPTVAVLSPGSGAAVSGVLAVSAQADDSVGVARMEVSLDGKLAGSSGVAGTATSARWTLDARGMAAGPHALTVSAVDGAGNRADKTLAVTVTGGAAPSIAPAEAALPVVILTPSLRDGINDEVAFGPDAVEASVTDRGGRVVFSSGGGPWDGTGAESGIYTARVRKSDGSENRFAVEVVR